MKPKSSSEWKAVAEAMDRAIHEGSLEMVTINVPDNLTQQTLVKFMQFFEQQMIRGLLMAKVEYRLKYLVDPTETVRLWVRNLYDSFLVGDDLRVKAKEKLQFVMQISSRYDMLQQGANGVLHGVSFRLTKFRVLPKNNRAEELAWTYPDSPTYTYNVFVTETSKPLSKLAIEHALQKPATGHRVQKDLIDGIKGSFKAISEGTPKTSFIFELRALEGVRDHHFRYNDVVKAVADTAARAVKVYSEVLQGTSFAVGQESKILLDADLNARCTDFRAAVMHQLISGLVNYFGYGVSVEGEAHAPAYLKLEFVHHKGTGAFNTFNVVAIHSTLLHPSQITNVTEHEIHHNDQYPDHLYYKPAMMLVRYQKFSRVAAELPA